MSKVVWHKGPPPSIGWWPASACRQPDTYRWWNGRYWGAPARSRDSSRYAGARAKSTDHRYYCEIEWRNRPADWPERSRT